MTTASGDNMTMKLKNNGSTIYQIVYDVQERPRPLHFIIPANTNIEITFTNVDATSHNVGVSCYGYYMEAF